MGFYEPCPKHNDLLLQRAATHADRLLPFCTVDPKLGPHAVAELERCLATGKFRGLKFHPWLQSFAPSMVKDTMIDLLKRAAAAHIPVIFHDGTPPYSTTWQIAQTARWVPECNIVLGHAGLADYTAPAAQLLKEIPNLYACLCGPRTADVRHLLDTAGPHKLCFGSDYGLSDHLILEDRLDSILLAHLDQDTQDPLLYRTAASLLHLE